ncbi:DNA helicase rad5 [Didymosphaeria variabile]|uniref:DNA helicase rad5 n=1 Tax=Didymosphaeria variabile TaxID=1932322 RepID=A0A9W8XMA6_9PLEO|nr:DNA helicase rad5 [Didymosphaeria variabile]KAJ4352505.1 DNA helicase rad5 [Didymosphaeria variabile]
MASAKISVGDIPRHNQRTPQAGDPLGILAAMQDFPEPRNLDSDENTTEKSRKRKERFFQGSVYQAIENGRNTPFGDQIWAASNYDWVHRLEPPVLLEAKSPIRLNDYQRHLLNRILYALFVSECGALLSLGTELDKTHRVIIAGESAKGIESSIGLLASDVVITTYQTLEAEYEEREKALKDSVRRDCHCPLMDLFWLALVLDESHTATKQTIITSQPVVAINAKFRVAIMGTE